MAEKKRAFSVDQFAKPIGQAPTSIGTVFVHQLDNATRDEFRALAAEAGPVRAGKILRKITSLSPRGTFAEPVDALSQDSFDALTEDDLAVIANLFYERRDWQQAMPEGPRPEIEARRAGESALAFFDRVVSTDLAREGAELKRIIEQLGMAANPLQSALKHMDRSGDQLQHSIERLAKLAQPVSAPMPRGVLDVPPVPDFVRQQAEARRDRREDRERLRLMSETTGKSAELLRELVNTAGVYMAGMDARDRKADRQVRTQLWIGVVSVVAGSVLALGAFVLAWLAYNQDAARNRADETAAAEARMREEVRDQLARQQLDELRELRLQNARIQSELPRSGAEAVRPSASSQHR